MGKTFEDMGFTPATYNPLDVLDRNDPNVVAVAQGLAAAVCPTAPGDKDKYWQGSAANVLTAVLLWITDQPGETKRTFGWGSFGAFASDCSMRELHENE